MLEKFKNLKGSTKILVIAGIACAVLTVCLVIAVVATGGFSNPFA